MSIGSASGAGAGRPAAGQVMPRELAGEIAREIQDAGEYRVALDPRDPQRLVDLRWAALAAGRALGKRVQIVMTKAVHDGDAPITARLVTAPAPRAVVPAQRRHDA
jgi:hypothetical protein